MPSQYAVIHLAISVVWLRTVFQTIPCSIFPLLLLPILPKGPCPGLMPESIPLWLSFSFTVSYVLRNVQGQGDVPHPAHHVLATQDFGCPCNRPFSQVSSTSSLHSWCVLPRLKDLPRGSYLEERKACCQTFTSPCVYATVLQIRARSPLVLLSLALRH